MKNRKPNRLKNYDYSLSGWYFVTICTQDHNYYFGNVDKGKIILNEFGKIVKSTWKWLPKQYKYLEIDEFIIMPNHLHGILIIDPQLVNNAGTGRDLSLRKNKIKIKSISELIGAFKTKSSKEIHLAGKTNFKWQRSFYDRIIRNEKELYNIRNYIQQNPLKWDLEKYINNLDL